MFDNIQFTGKLIRKINFNEEVGQRRKKCIYKKRKDVFEKKVLFSYKPCQ